VVGRDAQRDDVARPLPLARRGDRLAHRRAERRLVADHVVRGERPDDRARVPPLDDGGGEADRGRGVARRRLGDEVRRRETGQLLGDGGRVGGPGDERDAVRAGER
jgi:hypothetical protein